jgi:hypothetical protein
VERQHFAGAGAKVFLARLRSRVCKFLYNVKTPKFFIIKFEVEFKNHNFAAIYFKEPFDDHLCLSGIFDKQEPEPHKNGLAP